MSTNYAPPPDDTAGHYREGYRDALEQIGRELDNVMAGARNRNEYQRGKIDGAHSLRNRLSQLLGTL